MPRRRAGALFWSLLVLVLLFAWVTPAFAIAEFTAHTPAPGSAVQQSQPRISVRVYDPDGPRLDASVVFKIDGKQQSRLTMSYDRRPDGTLDTTRGTIACTPRSALSRGTHNIEVSVLNWAGARYSTAWSFRIGIYPVLDYPSPAPGSTVTTLTPTITAVVTQGSDGILPQVVVGGSVVPATFDPLTKTVSALVPTEAPLANDAPVEVTVTVTNSDGLSDDLTWSFAVLTQARMPDSTGGQPCQQCHPGYPEIHPMTNCDACHGYDGPIGGFYQPPDGHPADDPVRATLADCGSCHGAGFPTVPLHDQPLPTYHSAGSEAEACKPCHVSDLLAEHYYRDEVNDCMLCHGSPRAEVQTAIASGATGCLNCHDADHGGSHDSDIESQTLSGTYPSGSYGPYACTTCHDEVVTGEHFKPSSSSAAAGCDNCHPSPRDTLTPWAGGCVQGGCHVPGSGSEQHGMMAGSHTPSTGSTTSDGTPCIECHDDGDFGELHLGADDGTNTSCFVCHGGAQPPTVTDCTVCHTDRIEPHGYDPVQHTSAVAADTVSGSYPSGGTYGPIRCDACHQVELYPEHQRATSSSQAAGCSNCHPSPQDSLTPSWDQTCAQGGCHPAGSASESHGAMATAHALPPEDADCAASECHDDGDLGAIHVDADNGTQQECNVCHSSATMPVTKICTDCHGTPHGDLNAAHTADEPGGLTWANTGAYAPCIQCHYIDIRTEHAKPTSGSRSCNTCHVAGGPVDQLPPSGWNNQCVACHPTNHGQYETAHVQYGQDCAPCHGDPADARDFHPTCGVAEGDGYSDNVETGWCHVGPGTYPVVPPPGEFWCRTCHPDE